MTIKIKPLGWSDRKSNGDTYAQSVVGEYSVGEVHGTHMTMLRVGERDIRIARVSGFEQAKDAAQNDYERRIMSAIGHDLYETGDVGAPDEIKDRNGEVVLGLCKRCGRAEVELSEPCWPAIDHTASTA